MEIQVTLPINTSEWNREGVTLETLVGPEGLLARCEALIRSKLAEKFPMATVHVFRVPVLPEGRCVHVFGTDDAAVIEGELSPLIEAWRNDPKLTAPKPKPPSKVE